MGRGAWHPRRQDQLGRHSHRAGEGSRGQGANELKLEAVTPKSHPPLQHRWSRQRAPLPPGAMLSCPNYHLQNPSSVGLSY